MHTSSYLFDFYSDFRFEYKNFNVIYMLITKKEWPINFGRSRGVLFKFTHSSFFEHLWRRGSKEEKSNSNLEALRVFKVRVNNILENCYQLYWWIDCHCHCFQLFCYVFWNVWTILRFRSQGIFSTIKIGSSYLILKPSMLIVKYNL